MPALLRTILVLSILAAATLLRAASMPRPNVQVEVIARGLETPWAIAFSPDGRIFFTERPGRIRVIKNGALEKEPWMQIDVHERGEAGLLGLAVDPDFQRNRFLYAAHTYRDGNGKPKNRLVRLREDASTGKGILDKVLLDNVEGANNHDGGRVKFGPDGKIYWTTGDAQTTRFAQNLSSLNGKILRLNPDGTIPPDNPFPKSPVYSYGHRNAEGLAWQPGSARLYATEHGPSGFQGCCLDEINLIEPGKNYGWPEVRGDEKREGMVSPVLHSGTSDTWAPGGATFVTRGTWAGSLLFTGLRGESLYRIVFDPENPRKVMTFERFFVREYGRLRDVAEGPDGAIYILTSNRDGRGKPSADDDRVLRLIFK
jgi:glucose/arabinose dehydrogenase